MKFRVIKRYRPYWVRGWYVLQEKFGPFWLDCKLGPETNLHHTEQEAIDAVKFRNSARQSRRHDVVTEFDA